MVTPWAMSAVGVTCRVWVAAAWLALTLAA
jgi:hypothetical protein